MKYKIIYDIEKDIWNWNDALKNNFMGYDWVESLYDSQDKEIAKRIKNKSTKESRVILRNYLLSDNIKPQINKYKRISEADFAEKFDLACNSLEQVVGRNLDFNQVNIYITSFPRCPYDFSEPSFFLYFATDGFWGMPIDGFMHEMLHFIFIKYWRNNLKSRVSLLSESDFDYVKEALTTVLDKSIMPIISQPDQGYPNQKQYRQELHNFWIKNHDFNRLVDYSLDILDEYKNTRQKDFFQ